MSERAKAVPRSASWGAACAPCARAKARCIRSNKAAGDRCDRRSQQLEAKLDNLLESLKRPEQNPNLGHLGMQLRDSPEGSKAHSSSIFTGGQPGKIQTSDTGSIEIAPLPGYNTYARPLCTCSETIEQEDLVPSQPDEVLLSIYRSQLSAQFPFVIIPPRVTLAELRETRPFLLKVVRMIASIRNRRSMWGQNHAVMRHLTEAAMIRGERSLDLLQGILMFVGYFHYYCMAHGQFSNLIHLAVSMITDTGLDRHSKPREKNQFVAMDREEPRKLTSEEKRVVLGVWYMNSK
ncbi:hypothetical protein N7470_005013 [Penicillium chermesinum]|nr:hypothetical protein N7470_005013 [Penicillium chermesinum]